MYTTIHISSDNLCVGDLTQLGEIFSWLKVDSITMSIYPSPLELYGDTTPVKTFPTLSPSQALSKLSKFADMTQFLLLDCLGWAKVVKLESIDLIPNDLADGFIPWDLAMSIGRIVLPPGERIPISRELTYDLSMGGDGNPSDLLAYLEKFKSLPCFQHLQRLLKKYCVKGWETEIILT